MEFLGSTSGHELDLSAGGSALVRAIDGAVRAKLGNGFREGCKRIATF